MGLITNRAAIPRTGFTGSTLPGDDGARQIGVTIPVPRFTIIGVSDETTNQVRDNLTGLIWARNPHLTAGSAFGNSVSWSNAFNVINSSTGLYNVVNYGGTNDWRLPNWRELASLMSFQYNGPTICNTAGTGQWSQGNPFLGLINNAVGYWTSSIRYGGTMYYVEIQNGSIQPHSNPSGDKCYVWPVRGGL